MECSNGDAYEFEGRKCEKRIAQREMTVDILCVYSVFECMFIHSLHFLRFSKVYVMGACDSNGNHSHRIENEKKNEIINKSVTRDAIQWIHPAPPLHSDKLSIHNGIASLPSPSPSSSSSSPASLHSTVLSHLLIIDAYTHILWNLFNFNRFAVYTTQKPQVIRIFIFTTRVATATTNGNNVQWIEFLGICSRVQTIWYCVYCTLYKLHRNVSLQRKGSFMFDIAWIVLRIFPKLIRFFFLKLLYALRSSNNHFWIAWVCNEFVFPSNWKSKHILC